MNPNELEALAKECAEKYEADWNAAFAKNERAVECNYPPPGGYPTLVDMLLNFAAKVQAASGAEVRRLITNLIPKTREYVSVVNEYGGSAGYADTQTTKELREILTVIDTAAPAKDAGAREDTERLNLFETLREEVIQRNGTGDPELIGYQWGIQEQCHTLRDALDIRLDNARRAEGRKL